MTATKVETFHEQLTTLAETQRELEIAQALVSSLADTRASQVAALRAAGVPQWVLAQKLGITTGAVGHLTRRVREATR
ncbi:hypothetical protein HZD78_21490 [Mycobacteroides chelonae]|uniref:hypothetical protein n=1 Tax=Mycobacteroides chelonae TaxID=1774 RepID=UPI001C44BC3A|nr:hypothetical protein [Mycobacteroides chelonae]MBV6362528.1 hypothetical protein [Mycobacteroides chelonae]